MVEPTMSQFTPASPQLEVPTAPVDRRAAVRYQCELATSLRPMRGAEDEQWPARLRDISTQGVGILVGRRFEPGTQLTLELQSDDAGLAYTLAARVVRVEDRNGAFWLLGCVFARPLGDDELQKLL